MAYNFGSLTTQGWTKAKQWLKAGYGVYSNGKPPVDNAIDNNYQNYADNVAGTGAIATFKEANASNQFEINNGHTLIDTSLTINQTAVPATPTAVVNGTAGATTYTYKVVGRAGGLQAPSATVSKTTGNATLSATNSITLTFVPTPGFLVFDIYRTVGGSTQGMIGSISASFGPNVSTPTLTFTDTGLAGDGSTAPTVNTTGGITGDLITWGNVTINPLATPATPLITPQGTTGASTWAYKVVARSSIVGTGGHTAASSAGSTTTGNATLTATNSNLLAWQPVPGAAIYDVYRTTAATSPTTTGLIGSTQSRTFTDTGLAGDSSTAPTTNTTGVLNGGLAGDSIDLAQINDVNGNPEVTFTATASAVNGITVANAATANAPTITSGGTAGSDANIGLTINPKGTGTLTLDSLTTGTTVTIAGGVTADTKADVINIATGNAAGSGTKTVHIADGTTSGTGVTAVTVGAVSNVANTTTIQGGNGTAAIALTPQTTGTIVIGAAAGTGAIGIGTSSATQTVNVANGAGAPTVAIANTSTAGASVSVASAATATGNTDTVTIGGGNTAGTGAKTINIASGAPAGTGADTVNIGTGNAASTAAKVVNIATGTPNTSGNNKVTMGGGATSAVTMNAVVRSYQATNYQGTESGANNALVAALLDAGGNAVTVAAGLIIWLKLGHSLQAGANTLNLNSHGTDSIKKASNPATDLSVTAVSGSILMLIFDGSVWQCQGQ